MRTGHISRKRYYANQAATAALTGANFAGAIYGRHTLGRTANLAGTAIGANIISMNRRTYKNQRRAIKGHGIPGASGKPLSAAQIQQRRAAAQSPRARRGHNVSSVRSGRRI